MSLPLGFRAANYLEPMREKGLYCGNIVVVWCSWIWLIWHWFHVRSNWFVSLGGTSAGRVSLCGGGAYYVLLPNTHDACAACNTIDLYTYLDWIYNEGHSTTSLFTLRATERHASLVGLSRLSRVAGPCKRKIDPPDGLFFFHWQCWKQAGRARAVGDRGLARPAWYLVGLARLTRLAGLFGPIGSLCGVSGNFHFFRHYRH